MANVTRASRAARREQDRRILEVLAAMRGTGWVNAADVVARLHGRDGRRVAGRLGVLYRTGLVRMRDQRRVTFLDHEPRVTGLLEYSISDAGLAHLEQLDRDEPRLTTQAHRPWPRRHRIAHRHTPGTRR